MNVAFTILVVLIVLAAILLIVVVLLQNGKDGGQASTGDAVSSEILNEAAPASETPAFPVDIPQTDPTAE